MLPSSPTATHEVEEAHELPARLFRAAAVSGLGVNRPAVVVHGLDERALKIAVAVVADRHANLCRRARRTEKQVVGWRVLDGSRRTGLRWIVGSSPRGQAVHRFRHGE